MNKEKIELIERNVAATLAIENKKASRIAKIINRKFLEGKISSSEAIKRIKKHYLKQKYDGS